MAQDSNANGRDGEDRRVLVNVKNLKKYFPVRAGLLQRVKAWVKAVDDVSFHIYEGETFGLVGESGCGKTTVGRTILRLIPATEGEAREVVHRVINRRRFGPARGGMIQINPLPYFARSCTDHCG